MINAPDAIPKMEILREGAYCKRLKLFSERFVRMMMIYTALPRPAATHHKRTKYSIQGHSLLPMEFFYDNLLIVPQVNVIFDSSVKYLIFSANPVTRTSTLYLRCVLEFLTAHHL